ncbi:hypothetical protein M758_8G124700 [Ceratodon purpureus]|uniref:Uncharacterized protein n=1 Tax=Ceratodon purpureus TaxID=3225 RepID=A0A8T0H040_CERPU|nr:hypothetical protein KC19_8G130700 [Ceratodon purpureus]KAG0608689.1 hypothetical protein M758_8G124700 [Ceratodon purpureus]
MALWHRFCPAFSFLDNRRQSSGGNKALNPSSQQEAGEALGPQWSSDNTSLFDTHPANTVARVVGEESEREGSQVSEQCQRRKEPRAKD